MGTNWHILRWIRGFLFSSTNRELLVFLGFLGLSGLFWLMLALNQTYEVEIKVPVRLVKVPSRVVVTDGMEDTVRFVVRDKGGILVAYLYGDKIQPIGLNFQTYYNKGVGKGSVPVADVQRMLTQQLFSSTKVLSAKSDKVEFYYNYGQSKRLPVRLAGRVVPSGSCYVARIVFNPDTITAYASQRVLDGMAFMETEDVDLRNFSDTVTMEIPLKRPRGVKCEPSKVMVTFYPDVLMEETVEVPIIAVNVPKGKVLRMFPSKVRVRFIVGTSVVRQIRPEQFVVIADFQELETHPSDKCTLVLKSLPAGVRRARLETRQVDYLIEQQ